MVDHMHEVDISALVFEVSTVCEGFLRICALNTLLLPYTLYYDECADVHPMHVVHCKL